jgi:hypothetical protein
VCAEYDRRLTTPPRSHNDRMNDIRAIINHCKPS